MEAKSLKSRFHSEYLKALGKNPSFPLLASFWWLRSLLICGHNTPIFASIFRWLSPPCVYHLLISLIRIFITEFRTHPNNPGWSHFEILSYSCKVPCSVSAWHYKFLIVKASFLKNSFKTDWQQLLANKQTNKNKQISSQVPHTHEVLLSENLGQPR